MNGVKKLACGVVFAAVALTLIPCTYNRIDGAVIWFSRGSRIILR